MDRYVSSVTGNKNFRIYFTLDTVRSGLYKGDPLYIQYDTTHSFRILAYKHYWIRYSFHFPDKNWTQYTYSWPLDSLGNVVKLYPPAGIPLCNSDSTPCSYIDSVQAISIAVENGIHPSITPLYAELDFDIYSKGMVVWRVVSEVEKTQWHNIEEIYLIDLIAGKILKIYQSKSQV